jgi:hypothetical protein
MSLGDYTALKAAVAGFLHRTDLADAIPDFVALTEAQMNRRLRVRRMMGRATASIADGYATVPADFLGAVAFDIDGERLSFLTPDQMSLAVQGGETGRPAYYSIVGGEFRFYPTPSGAGAANLSYWRAIPALSDAAATNWVLANHPDAYLYGALTQAAPYLRDDARLTTWGALYERTLADVEAADRAESDGALTPISNGYAW